MLKFLDRLATIHRNARVLGAAIVLVPTLLWFGWRLGPGRPPPPAVSTQAGEVVAVTGEPAPGKLTPIRVRLDGGEELALIVSYPPPAVGDRVRLRVETDQDGDRTFSFDRQAWLTGP